MEQQRPYVLSLAGLDPSGGAGLLADIKTFEMQRLCGLGVCTALTMQTADHFYGVQWVPVEQILAQLQPLLSSYAVSYCKIGLVENAIVLQQLLETLHTLSPGIRVILDPVLSASAGYTFHHREVMQTWQSILPLLYLLTPNYHEAMLLSGEATGEAAATYLSQYCAVLLKGGHRPLQPGWDTLYQRSGVVEFAPAAEKVYPKHGSGCVLSAAITAQLVHGVPLAAACLEGKRHTAQFLSSHPSLTGYHYI
ncbi:hydroxymethylpyrimidine/phosphomethylpyrimidine kinase [Chitinophaga pendula]|uniref:hydroxymethylpyrimidine/phosphomethylpyrimidine kinase n=1 Tax=Chitinophaga TaxID=79328 RepID=UPI000BAECFF5|nr:MULTISPECIES: hydroxymethylpyrimidine/phosphomethylpyrimidine kinase [Chitinophaga]ASZ10253.1 hydroxymethylpyrimidine/phosphomethylpyrimidine kinase [Chitinophaga sp. MD30]UCJ06787.1 hydroxymethylpyrimidine/phosphomethylpyrimidine kinase [Chitinophaga pendula]